jgi:hypothetical protein
VSAGGHRRAGDRQVGGHRGHRTPSQPSGWPRRTPRRTGRPRRCGTPRPSARPLATVSGPPHAGSSTAVACGSSGPGPGPAAPARVGRSAVAAARTTGVHASGRVRSAAGHPSRTADRRRHRHGHRHQRGHVCRTPPVRTPPVRRAAVPEAADGQSADRSRYNFLYSSSRPALRAAAYGGRPRPAAPSPRPEAGSTVSIWALARRGCEAAAEQLDANTRNAPPRGRVVVGARSFLLLVVGQ